MGHHWVGVGGDLVDLMNPILMRNLVSPYLWVSWGSAVWAVGRYEVWVGFDAWGWSAAAAVLQEGSALVPVGLSGAVSWCYPQWAVAGHSERSPLCGPLQSCQIFA